MNGTKNTQSARRLAGRRALKLIECLVRDEHAQDLIEYALVFSFVALGAIASMKSLSANIALVFSSIGTTLTSAT